MDAGDGDAAVRDGGAMDAPPADGGSDGGFDSGLDVVPPFRNPVATPDEELARDALRILGLPAAGATEPAAASATRSRARASAIGARSATRRSRRAGA